MPRNRATAAAITTFNSISKVKSPFSNLISLQSLLHPIKTSNLLKSFNTVAARADYYHEPHLNSNPQVSIPNRTAYHHSPNETLNPNNQDRNFRVYQSSIQNPNGEGGRASDGYLRSVTGFYSGGGGLSSQESSVGVQRNHDGTYAGTYSGGFNENVNGNESQVKPNGLNREDDGKFQRNTYAMYGGNLGGFDKNANAYQVQQNENGHYAQGNIGFKQIPNLLRSGGGDSLSPFNHRPEDEQTEEAGRILGTIEELDGFCKENKMKEAVEVLELLEKNGIAVDTPRYALLVQMCADIGVLDYAKSVHGHITRSTVPTNVSDDNKILEMYIKCGSITDAYEVFEKMSARNMTTWDTMIIGLAKSGLGEDALDLFTRFKETGLTPDGQMFMSVFYACSVLCDVDEGMLHFESMSKEYDIAPSMEHYTSVVKMLASIGYLDEAKEFIEKIPIEPSVDVWETLMNISSLHGNIEFRDRCAAIINDLDPSYLARKSAESSLSAKSSDLVEEKKRQKLSDSLADVGTRTSNFKAGDRSHPDSDNIYRVLKGMSAQLKEAGYVPLVRVVLHDVCQEAKEEAIFTHSEKLAVAQGLINTAVRQPLRIMKNLRICLDCHQAMMIISKITGRMMIIRDNKRFHHFQNGNCTCNEFW
ncbi:hypothetical protein ACHQM5_020650 [Ranunculus cassubicifolius]